MSSQSDSILTTLLGALQASVAVLLTILVGVVAAQFELLSAGSAREISQTCVRLFLPALLISNVGEQLHLDTGAKYLPILVWSLLYNTLSIALGSLCTRFFSLPAWATPAISFNNTTALPLLLIQSLDASGILATLDPADDVVERAKSFFLVNAMVSSSLTFALGPKLLNGQEEDAPDGEKEGEEEEEEEEEEEGEDEDAAERGQLDGTTEQEEERAAERSTEETTLLPTPVALAGVRARNKTSSTLSHRFAKLPPSLQSTLHFSYQFLNAPLIGAALGALIGLVPALHTLFFAPPHAGGYLTAWLTSAIKNTGALFATLQVVVVGVKLSQSLLRMKRGEASGAVPWGPFVFVSLVRFVLWPLISIPVIWALATRTGVLGSDPVLWFAMMIMPVGPPAMKLTALADVNGSPEAEKMSIAKFLTLSYIISPLICFSVVGSLKASQAAAAQ